MNEFEFMLETLSDTTDTVISDIVLIHNIQTVLAEHIDEFTKRVEDTRYIAAVSSRFEFVGAATKALAYKYQSTPGSIGKIDPQTALNIVTQELYRLVTKARREIALPLCPIDTGAMRASIYVSNPFGSEARKTQTYSSGMRGTKRSKGALGRNKHLFEATEEMIRDFGSEDYLSNLRKQIRPKNAQQPGERLRGMLGKRRGSLGFVSAAEYSFMPFGGTGGGSPNAMGIEFGVSVYYAGYVEFGHQGAPAQPFFTPAVEYVKANMNDVIRIGVEKAFKGMNGA